MKKLIAIFLVFSLIGLYANLYAKERRGTDLVIQKTDGNQVKGELIAVKQNSLLLKEAESGADVSVDVKDVMVITIKKKSKALLGAGIGLLVGAGIGWGYYEGSNDGSFNEQMAGSVVGGALWLLGLIGGTLIGAQAGKDKTIQIEGKSEPQIRFMLEELRKKARVTDFQ